MRQFRSLLSTKINLHYIHEDSVGIKQRRECASFRQYLLLKTAQGINRRLFAELNGRGKNVGVIPQRDMQTWRGRVRVTLLILYVGARGDLMPAAYPCQRAPVATLWRRLGRLQGRSRRMWKRINFSSPSGFKVRTVQPLASRYPGPKKWKEHTHTHIYTLWTKCKCLLLTMTLYWPRGFRGFL